MLTSPGNNLNDKYVYLISGGEHEANKTSKLI
jgi:hypothetical protein